MGWRLAAIGWVILAWLGGTVLGLTTAVLGTDVGRQVLVRWGVAYANGRIQGTLTVGEVGGSFLGGLVVNDVRLADPDGSPVITARRLGVQYRVRDLLRGRIVFGRLIVDQPNADLVQPEPGAPFNISRSLRASQEGGGGLQPLIAFADVQITEGRLQVRTPWTPGDTSVPEVEPGPSGPLRVRRFEGIQALFPYVRLSSPFPREDDVVLLTREFEVTSTDPAVRITDAEGRVSIFGDSLTLALNEVALPASRLELSGSIGWAEGDLRYGLAGEADGARLDDVRGLVPALPEGLEGDGRFTVRSRGSDVLAVVGDDLDLRGRDAGRLRGRLGMVFGPGDRWQFEGTELQLDTFDLEYVRGYLDTLPVAGRVTGRVTFDGPGEQLHVSWDGEFRDALVEGRPVSGARAEGMLMLGGDEGAVFRDFGLEDADISLATIQRMVPAVTLLGRVRGTGVLNGAWRNATYEGSLRYAHGPRPGTEAQGAVRLDTRGDTLALSADLQLDSLRLESFRSSYPAFTLRGAWSGRVALEGRLDSLVMRADVTGPAGGVSGEGALVLLADRKGMRRLDLHLRQVDASVFDDRAPATNLTGQVIGQGTVGPDGDADFLFVAALDSTVVRGITIDSAGAQVRLTDEAVTVDTLRMWGAALQMDVRGRLAIGDGDRRDTLRFLARTSSLAALEPVLAPLLGPLEVDEDTPLPTGSAQVAGQIVGSLAAYLVVADIDLQGLRRGELYVARGGGTATWVSASRTLRFDGSVDSAQVGGVAMAGAQLRLHGRPDSLNWQGRSRFGRDGAWLGGGTWRAEDAARLITIDSLRVLLASGPWSVDTAAAAVVDDSGLVFTGVTFARARPPGRVTVQGRLPLRGTADLVASVEALPIQDIWVLLQRDPEEVGGELGGTVRLRGTARAPEASFDLALREGVFGEFRAPIVEASAEYARQELTGVVDLWRRGERILNVDLALPVDLALANVARRQLPGPIRVQARAQGVDLALLEATTPMVRQMQGTLDADVGITGSWERPELTGTLALRDGAATYPALGVRHEQMNGRLRLSGDRIYVEQLSLRSGQGAADITGSVRLAELSRPILDLTVNAREFRAIDVSGFLSLTATADLQLDGPLYNAALRGSATATRGVLYFADLITKDIVNLQDTLFQEFVDTTLLRRQGLGPEFESRFLDSLRIDSLSVEMGREFWLRSSEANIQLAGRVFVSKLREQYRIDGALEAPRGAYRLQLGLGTTREFTVTRGEVRYFGTPDLNADLDIDARHVVRTVRREDVTVFVHIGGTLYEPELTLSSDIRPAISESEIISYLLVGAPSFQAGLGATRFETRLISQQVLGALSQRVLGALSSQLEYALISDLGLPVDYLQIRQATGDFSGAEFAVGKQFEVLGKTAFLTASKRICPGQEIRQLLTPGASLEFWMSRRWLVSASFDPVRGCETLTTPLAVTYQLGLDVFWETSY